MILGVLTAFGPITTDLYLPALPDVGHALGVPASQVQVTLTASLVGLAAGQAIAGPLSDSLGRRRPLCVGLVLYTLSSLGCAVAPSIAVLDALRLLQGLAGATGIVLARAIVRDVWSGAAAARIYALLFGAISLGPILAPSIGGALVSITDWRGLFVVLAGVGAALLLAALARVRETLPPAARRATSLLLTLRVGRRLLADRRFAGYVLTSGLSFGALFSYISGSSFVFQEVFGLSAQLYAVMFGVNGVALLLASFANHRLQERLGPHRLLAAGMTLLLAGAALLTLVTLAGAGLAPFVATLWIATAGVGLIGSNAIALALEPHGADAGTASAIIGVIQFLIGAIAAPIPGVAGASAVPMALGVLGFTLASLAVHAGLIRASHAVEQAREAA